MRDRDHGTEGRARENNSEVTGDEGYRDEEDEYK